MNERFQAIISLFIEKPHIEIKEMMSRLKLSRRQVNYAIGKINESLQDLKLEPIKRNYDGSFQLPEQLQQLLLKPQNKNHGEMRSDLARVILILINLMVKTHYVSLFHLTTLLDVSKTTAAKDIQATRHFLKKRPIKLNYNRQRGYYLEGSQVNLIKLAMHLLTANPWLMQDAIIQALLIKKAASDHVIDFIAQFEKAFGVKFSDKSYELLVCLVEIIRLRANQTSFKLQHLDPMVQQTKEWRFVSHHFEPERKIDNGFQQWLTIIFLSANLYDKAPDHLSQDEWQLLQLIHQMAEAFKTRTLVTIKHQSDYEHKLLNHIRPACFRVKFGLPSEIGQLTPIADQHHQVLTQLIQQLLLPIENWLGKPFPQDEIKLLTYYFGYLRTNNLDDTNKPVKYKAAVVCSNGVIMSKIIMAQLQMLFSESFFFSTLSARDFKASDANYDLVFSTLPLKTDLPLYMIKPGINYADDISFKYHVLNSLDLKKEALKVDNYLTVIKQYAEIKDAKGLRQALGRLLDSNQLSSELDEAPLPNLTDYLKLCLIFRLRIKR